MPQTSSLKLEASTVVISGSNERHGSLSDVPKWREDSKAAHFAAVMRGEGYEKELILEPNAQNTGENAQKSTILLNDVGKHPASILIVTKSYMERRALRTFEKQWPGAEHVTFYVASVSGTFEEYVETSQSFEQTIHGMVGDLDRIMTYPARRFMTPSDVPDGVIRALDMLKSSGFTHRIK